MDPDATANATLAGKPGSQTTEWKALLGTMAMVTATIIGGVVDAGLVEGQWLVLCGLALNVLAALGYGTIRTVRKNAKTKAMAIVAAADKGITVSPPASGSAG